MTRQQAVQATRLRANKALGFDANGNLKGVGGSGTNQSALSGTCWQSFAPTL